MTKQDAVRLISSYCNTDALGRPINRIRAICTEEGTLEIMPKQPLWERYNGGVLLPGKWDIQESVDDDLLVWPREYGSYASAVLGLIRLCTNRHITGVLIVR